MVGGFQPVWGAVDVAWLLRDLHTNVSRAGVWLCLLCFVLFGNFRFWIVIVLQRAILVTNELYSLLFNGCQGGAGVCVGHKMFAILLFYICLSLLVIVVLLMKWSLSRH